MGDRIPMHRRAASGRLASAARAWPGFPATGAGPALIPAGAAFPVGRAATPVTPRARPGRMARLLPGPLARRVIRWHAERRVLHELLAPYEKGGYQPSAPTWRRLREEARAVVRGDTA